MEVKYVYIYIYIELLLQFWEDHLIFYLFARLHLPHLPQ